MSDEKVSAAEIIGEIRKGVRFYEVFAEAEKVARFIADKDRYLAELTSDIKEAEAVSEAMDKKLSDLDVKLDQKVKDVEAVSVEASEIRVRSDAERDAVLKQARKEVSDIISSIEGKKASLEAEIGQLTKDRFAAEDAYQQAVARLQLVNDEAQKQKERLLKAFD